MQHKNTTQEAFDKAIYFFSKMLKKHLSKPEIENKTNNEATLLEEEVIISEESSDETVSAPETSSEENFIEKVIATAKARFIDGFANNVKFKEKLKHDPALQTCLRNPKCLTKSKSPKMIDENFLLYDANLITGTNFIAAAGPKNPKEVLKFFMDTAFNNKIPIEEYIILGNKLANNERDQDADFFDYASGKNKFKIYSTPTNDISLEIAAQKLSGKYTINKAHTIIHPKAIIQTELKMTLKENNASESKQTSKTVNVAIIPIRDMNSINLSQEDFTSIKDANLQPLEERKEILWRLYEKSLTKRTLIHCTAGHGRTGHLILIFEFLKNYEEIIKSNDEKKIADDILQLVDRIRTTRPGLILTDKQFENALRNGEILFNYAVEKKYIHVKTPFSPLLFSQKQEAIKPDLEKEKDDNEDVTKKLRQLK